MTLFPRAERAVYGERLECSLPNRLSVARCERARAPVRANGRDIAAKLAAEVGEHTVTIYRRPDNIGGASEPVKVDSADVLVPEGD
jgi:hypothetical protein